MRQAELIFNLGVLLGIPVVGFAIALLLAGPYGAFIVVWLGFVLALLICLGSKGAARKTVAWRLASAVAVLTMLVLIVPPICRWLGERSDQRNMTEQFDEIRQGKRSDLYIYTFSNFNELLADPDAAARVTSIRNFECPASQHKWSLLKQLPNLNELSFYCCDNIDPVLEGVKGMASLEHIYLTGCTYFTDKGMACIPSFVKLKAMRVFGPVTDTGLAQLRGDPNLECLSLVMTDVTDDGLAVLKDMPRLRHLAIEYDRQWAAERAKSGFNHGTGPTDAAITHLKALTQLESLNLDGDWVSEAAVDELRKALPNCKITVSSVVAGE